MNWEIVTTLPPGSASRTLLGRLGPRFAALRELERDGAVVPQPAPGLVPLREIVVLGGKRYAAFDVVEAVTLREVIDAFGSLGRLPPLGLVARVVVDAARAISGLSPALPHGGLSDSALLVGFTGTTSVMDFGAPRGSRFVLPGAPSFSNDVFSLGAVLHATLTGFDGNYGDALADGVPFQHASQHNPEAAPVLDDVLSRALARAVDLRQPDAELLADELEAVLAESLFTPGDIAMVLGSMLAARRTHLTDLLEGAAKATSSTMPQLGVAAPKEDTAPAPPSAPLRTPESADDRTGAHLVPWITEAEAAESPAPAEPAQATEPRIDLAAKISLDPFQPIPMRTLPAAVVDLPLEQAVEPTQPRQRVDLPPEEDELEPAEAHTAAQHTQPRALLEPSAEQALRSAETVPRIVTKSEPGEQAAPLPSPLPVDAEPVPRVAAGPRILSGSRSPVRRSRPAAPVQAPTPTPPPPTQDTDEELPPAPSPHDTNEQLPPVSAPRNTTEIERLRARGQERIPTPPLGVAVDGTTQAKRTLHRPPADTNEDEPAPDQESEVSENIEESGEQPPADTSEDEPQADLAVEEAEGEAPPPASNARLWAVIGVLGVVVVGLILAIVQKQGLLGAAAPPVPVPLKSKPVPAPPPLIIDAGVTEVDDSTSPDAADEPDAANEAQTDEETDAGAAEVVVEAEGDVVVSADKKPPPPKAVVKKPHPKKRKHK